MDYGAQNSMPQHQELQDSAPNQFIPLLDISPLPKTPTTITSRQEDVFDFTPAPEKRITITPSYDRTVNRKLRGIHLFMITINAVLGSGLYWRGGQILEFGGPLAVLLSFLVMGLLAWAVMQCITEMLCIWPIPGALSTYVSEFVDVELGIAVGIAYWFTYSVSFSALIATTAAEFGFWPTFNDRSIEGGIGYFCMPLVLVLINTLGIKYYRIVEVVAGTMKISFLAAVIVLLIVINLGLIEGLWVLSVGFFLSALYPIFSHLTDTDWAAATAFDSSAADNWGTALLMSLSFGTFAYVGVEVVAASALEVQWPRRSLAGEKEHDDSNLPRRSKDTLIGKSVQFSAIFISFLATVAYTVSGLLATFDIERNDCQLPRLSWASNTDCISSDPSSNQTSNSASAFVIIAQQSQIPHLPDVFNFFLVFTCLSCANTNLYVASRALFGLTSRLDGHSGQLWYLRLFAWFGRTNRHKVPVRSMVFSAIAFSWVPFLQLGGGTSVNTPINIFVEVLGEMGSVGVVIVWACACLAFIRYYQCIKQHRVYLEAEKISQVRRFCEMDSAEYHDYPYRSHGQPFLAYTALSGCLFVLFVANGAYLWNGFHQSPFLSSYLTIMVFLALWILLKVIRGARWAFVDLSNPQRVAKKIRDLHDIRLGAT